MEVDKKVNTKKNQKEDNMQIKELSVEAICMVINLVQLEESKLMV